MASLLSYGACQTACNAGAVACYASAGAVFGAVTLGVGTPAAIVACNTVLGVCMAACAAKFAAEGTAETAATGGFMGPIVGIGGAILGLYSYFGRGSCPTTSIPDPLLDCECILEFEKCLSDITRNQDTVIGEPGNQMIVSLCHTYLGSCVEKCSG